MPRLESPRLPRCDDRGQALVEFAFVLLPIMLVMVGIVQFGLLFNANVAIANAAREGARAGTIYVYVGSDKNANDRNRCTAILTAATQAFGLLSTSAPHFSATSPCPAGSGDTWQNGDLLIEYSKPDSVTANDSRKGYRVTVTLTYRSDLIVPLVGSFLATDGNGRFVQQARVTMVVN